MVGVWWAEEDTSIYFEAGTSRICSWAGGGLSGRVTSPSGLSPRVLA